MVTTLYDDASGVSRLFRVKKNLNLNNLIDQLSHVFHSVPDKRRAARCSYQQHDVMVVAVSCMFFQEPSWLQYQKQSQDECGSNNLNKLFHVKKIPQKTQVRQILNQIDSEQCRLVFKRLFELAREDKQL